MADSNKGQFLKPVVPLAKAEGAFLALAAGDALGWPQEMRWKVRGNSVATDPHVEFKTWTRRSGGRFRPYEEIIEAGAYSDDTQLMLAAARSRANHGANWWKAFVEVELPFWTLYERGGGGATKRAAKAWVGGKPPWKSNKRDSVRRYFEAGGNGVAMRVLPHALFLAGQEIPASLMQDVVLDGSATHGHPRALIGATVYAYAAWSLARRNQTLGFGELLDQLIDGASIWGTFPKSDRGGGSWIAAANRITTGRYESNWRGTVNEMRKLLKTARNGIRAGALADDHAVLDNLGCFGPSKGAGTISAAAAMYLATRHAAQPVQGIVRAAFESGADTDTLAAMTGGLMGCLSGVEWLPEPWLDVQDAHYLRKIAVRIAMGPEAAEKLPVKRLSNPQSMLAKLSGKGKHVVSLSDSRQVSATSLPHPRPISKSISVRAWRLSTSEGQTMYVTKVNTLRRKTRTGWVTDKPATIQRTFPGTEIHRTPTTIKAVEMDDNPKNALYIEFCRQLQNLLKKDAMKTKEIEEALGLVQSQARKWLAKAIENRVIQRVSKKPVKYALNRKFLLRSDRA